MSRRQSYWASAVLWLGLVLQSWAGGSGLNVLIVVNQASSNSVQLGNYYQEQRQVPPQNYLRINWTGDKAIWTLGDFTTNLLTPVTARLASARLTNQIDYILLSMDIPFQLSDGISQKFES